MTNIICTASIEINAPKSKVWDALINPVQIKKYLFGTDAISDWKVGSPIKFTGVWEGKPYEDKGTILQIDKEKTLRYNYWSNFSGQEDKPENYQVVTYNLTEGNGKTKFTLTQDNCKSEEAREHSEKNWAMVLNTIKELVEKV